MGEKFFEAGKSDLIDKSEEIEGKLLKEDDKKNDYNKGSEEFRANSKRKSRIQKVIDGEKQNKNRLYNEEREVKRQTESVEDWKDSIETIEDDPIVKSEEEVEMNEDSGVSSDKTVFAKSEIENNREAGQLKSENEVEDLSISFQEFIDEMEKGSVSNGKIMVIKDEIEKIKKYNIIQNRHILEEKLKELKKDGDTDNKKNSIIIKIDQFRDLNEKVEQISEFIIENDQKVKQSRESEAEQQAVIETEETETTEETTEEQGAEFIGSPESYRGIIESLKETNRMVNNKIANLSLEDKDLVEELGLGGDLSAKNLEKAKNVIKLRNLEKATASDVYNAKIASSLYAGTHKETMIILDETLKRIEEQGSSLMNGILDMQLKEKQRAQLETQRAMAVDNLTEAVGNARRQQSGVQEGENHGPVSARESLDGIDSNVAKNINKIGSRHTMNKTHNIITQHFGASESEIKAEEIKFEKNILNNLKDRKFKIVKENCNEAIRKAKENTDLDEEKIRILVAFYEKIIEFTNDREKDQGFLKGLKNRIFRKKTETPIVEETSTQEVAEETPQVTPKTPQTQTTPESQTSETPQTTQETPVINDPDAEKINDQIKEKIKEKLRTVKSESKDEFEALGSFKISIDNDKTVDENCYSNPFFKKLIVDNLTTSMSKGEKDEIYRIKTKKLLDLYDEIKSEKL